MRGGYINLIVCCFLSLAYAMNKLMNDQKALYKRVFKLPAVTCYCILSFIQTCFLSFVMIKLFLIAEKYYVLIYVQRFRAE